MSLDRAPRITPAADDGLLILASASPRRRALLEAAGLAFTVQVPDVHEPDHQKGHPLAQALATALAKGRAVLDAVPDGARIIAADTMVLVDDRIFNKPEDAADARRMLEALAGRTHQVLTAVVLARRGGPMLADVVTADVEFYPPDSQLLDHYIASGESLDKAGAYGIQGLGARLVAGVRGDLTAVIGLPMRRLNGLHRESCGRSLFDDWRLPEIARAAFPDLAALPPGCMEGLIEVRS
jgi:septum formation protein